jgi:hypothetical protein
VSEEEANQTIGAVQEHQCVRSMHAAPHVSEKREKNIALRRENDG